VDDEAEGASVNRPGQTTLLTSVLGWTMLWGPAPAVAQLDDGGVGFVMRSDRGEGLA
jgi:hypothetical protein